MELRYDWVPDQVPCTQETLRKIKERFANEAHQLRLLKKRNIPPNEVTIELGLFFTYFSMLFSTHILHFSPFFSTFSIIFSIFSWAISHIFLYAFSTLFSTPPFPPIAGGGTPVKHWDISDPFSRPLASMYLCQLGTFLTYVHWRVWCSIFLPIVGLAPTNRLQERPCF